MIGQSIGRYTIESQLGEGGMGIVFKARDTQLGRAVAIKILPPDKVADPDRKRRFVQEAQAASALNHPHIITIYDIGSDGTTDFIVMEYLTGTKPSNVMITDDGGVKILDFGIAKLLGVCGSLGANQDRRGHRGGDDDRHARVHVARAGRGTQDRWPL